MVSLLLELGGVETFAISLSVYLRRLPKDVSSISIKKCRRKTMGYVCERTLDTDSFIRFKKVKTISIMDIGLTTIKPNAFRGPKGLGTILIQDNKSLSHLRLTYAMFQGLDPVGRLFIICCDIPSVEDGTFRDLRSLSFLGLQSNKISSISKGMFTGLTKLIRLQLQNNQISIIENDSFVHLMQLEILLLEKNQICQNNEGTFRGLIELVVLEIQNNKISEVVPKSFNNLRKLQKLSLYGNFLRKISRSHFKGLDNLLSLDLANNVISVVEKESFSDFKQMKYIYLSENNLSKLEKGLLCDIITPTKLLIDKNKITVIEAGLFCFNSISEDQVNKEDKYFHLGDNRLTYLTKEMLDGLVRITVLWLANNEIGNIDGDAFSSLEQLRILDLSNNKITFILNETFIYLKYLTRLQMAGNCLKFLHRYYFNGLNAVIDVSNNMIQSLESGTFALPSLYSGTILSVSLGNNSLSAISWMMFLNGSSTFTQNPPSFKIRLDARGNKLTCER